MNHEYRQVEIIWRRSVDFGFYSIVGNFLPQRHAGFFSSWKNININKIEHIFTHVKVFVIGIQVQDVSVGVGMGMLRRLWQNDIPHPNPHVIITGIDILLH